MVSQGAGAGSYSVEYDANVSRGAIEFTAGLVESTVRFGAY